MGKSSSPRLLNSGTKMARVKVTPVKYLFLASCETSRYTIITGHSRLQCLYFVCTSLVNNIPFTVTIPSFSSILGREYGGVKK